MKIPIDTIGKGVLLWLKIPKIIKTEKIQTGENLPKVRRERK